MLHWHGLAALSASSTVRLKKSSMREPASFSLRCNTPGMSAAFGIFLSFGLPYSSIEWSSPRAPQAVEELREAEVWLKGVGLEHLHSKRRR